MPHFLFCQAFVHIQIAPIVMSRYDIRVAGFLLQNSQFLYTKFHCFYKGMQIVFFFSGCGGETWNEVQSNMELAKRPVIKQNNQCSVTMRFLFLSFSTFTESL